MKVEMGESLCYSWLRHVKRCQIAQTDWRASPHWKIVNIVELEALERAYDAFCRDKYGLDLFRGSSLQQFLVQAEADVLGLALAEPIQSVYAIDVEYHEDGLGGSKEATAGGIVKNFVRTMQKKALVVIDIQNDITKNYKEIIDNINQAVDWAIEHERARHTYRHLTYL